MHIVYFYGAQSADEMIFICRIFLFFKEKSYSEITVVRNSPQLKTNDISDCKYASFILLFIRRISICLTANCVFFCEISTPKFDYIHLFWLINYAHWANANANLADQIPNYFIYLPRELCVSGILLQKRG